MQQLTGKRGLIVGVANSQSIAWGCAHQLHAAGATSAITYLNHKAEPYVRPLAESIAAPLILPCDVEQAGELEAVFAAIQQKWGRLDYLIHAIAYAPMQDLHGRVVDCSEAGFLRAMSVSCHSFIRMAKLAEPLMTQGGTLLTMSYYGAEKVIDNYGLMGPVKAALESTARYLAVELAGQGIRVHAISPGPLPTRAASGITHFDQLMTEAIDKSPLHRLATPDDVGQLATFLVSDAARVLTGSTFYVDAGYNIVG
ncbi:enoyl-ACP reductase FabI [Chitinimonas sp. BJB300]|uniref:enoyl-ACP reductase FabI n=1 Tax=Chitinimonas sp. BJB300 TaxID=1559339 RepID=UPI000C0E44EE|nr:enoyl-ACP reductase FabI [Chitinimonas sp. BJB300]PHV10222.1 enoyl-[acyl-carrier-protein] reductase FabI [Chitinimonas sp. BJB300]TSJ89964.1 enoyl-ACP reductase FabI [Chitinimonas sp. BJB300]